MMSVKYSARLKVPLECLHVFLLETAVTPGHVEEVCKTSELSDSRCRWCRMCIGSSMTAGAVPRFVRR